jgi:hypothetical protein
MPVLFLVPPALQALAMLGDEGFYHRRRGLPRWERVGHPLDTLTTALAYGWLVLTSPESPHALAVYVGLCAFSCLFITKDEFVHARLCSAGEGFLHAVLFVLHPIVFLAFGMLWMSGNHAQILRVQLGLTLSFATYQVLYWSVLWKPELVLRSR